MAKGSRWESDGTAGLPYEAAVASGILSGPQPEGEALVLKGATIQRNVLGHYYIVGYLPGDVRVAGWLHERPIA